MAWGRGRDTIERLLEDGELERVPASGVLADRLMREAAAHLGSARAVVEDDPTGAYQLAYDGARKACAALLAVQGLRATSRGGHVAVQDSVREQFGAVFGAYGRMRRRRRDGEYPAADTPTITPTDAEEGITQAEAMIEAAHQLLSSGELTSF